MCDLVLNGDLGDGYTCGIISVSDFENFNECTDTEYELQLLEDHAQDIPFLIADIYSRLSTYINENQMEHDILNNESYELDTKNFYEFIENTTNLSYDINNKINTLKQLKNK